MERITGSLRESVTSGVNHSGVGPDVGSPCAFPFTIGDETYSECVEGQLETGCVSVTYWGFLTIKTCKVTELSLQQGHFLPFSVPFRHSEM